MAELLVAQSHVPPDLVAMRLREELADDLLVVVGAEVQRIPLDALVVASQGLLVLHLYEEWDCSSSNRQDGGAADTIRLANQALAAFLADEFPGLRPAIEHLVVVAAPEAEPTTRAETWPPAVSLAEAARAVASTPWPAGAPSLDAATRRALALALQERRLTRTQRATVPFTFRSGGRLGSGRQVWTVRELVAHLDRTPDDGVFHLRDGSLVRWFEEQGADHLARHARATQREFQGDDRAALEAFLIDAGLVERPPAVVRPQMLDLGTVVAGETATGRLSIGQGRGRGYLTGTLRPVQPWLQVEPNRLRGGKLEALVSAVTEGLPIQAPAHTGQLQFFTNAAPAPILVAVRVRVVARPSVLQRTIVRPLGMALVCGLLGTGLGRMAVPLDLSVPAGSLLWAAGGFWAAWRLREATSVAVPAKRWLLPLLLAAGTLFSVGVVLGWLAGSSLNVATGAGTALLAPLPALLLHRTFRRRLPRQAPRAGHQGSLGWLEISVATASLLAALAVLVRPAPLAGSIATAEAWLASRLQGVERSVDDLSDRWLLRTYDHRAPSVPLVAPASPLHTPEEAP